VELTFATPLWALVGLLGAMPLAALLLTEQRAARVRTLLHLRRPTTLAALAPAVALVVASALVATAAAQPVLVERDEQLVRRDAELYVVIDTSRSMLAASDAEAPTRFERAQQVATTLRREFADLPIGLVSLTDRALVHLFPTTDAAAYAATLRRAMGVDRPPPRAPSQRASKLSGAGEISIWNYFSPAAKRRLAVVVTDGEGQRNDPRDIRETLRDGVRVSLAFVHVWASGERVFGATGPEAAYTADPASRELLADVAAAARGRMFSEADTNELTEWIGARLPPAVPTDVGDRARPRPLAPWAAAAAFAPLAFLLRRRNRA
jgi:hypothetical protein